MLAATAIDISRGVDGRAAGRSQPRARSGDLDARLCGRRVAFSRDRFPCRDKNYVFFYLKKRETKSLRRLNNMRRKALEGILAGLGVVLLWSSFSLALNTWKVSDLSGDVTLSRGDERIAAAVGMDILPGDALTIMDGSWIELVSAATCDVWELEGNRRYRFTERGIISHDGKNVSPSHRLSACFDPSGFSQEGQRMGGAIERSNK